MPAASACTDRITRIAARNAASPVAANRRSPIIAKLAGWIRANQPPQLLEDGRQIRDWVHVNDIVATVLALARSSSAPPIVNVCSGAPTRLVEACEILANVAGTDCRPDIVGGFRSGDMRHCLGDATTLRNLIGREPISFRDGAGS